MKIEIAGSKMWPEDAHANATLALIRCEVVIDGNRYQASERYFSVTDIIDTNEEWSVLRCAGLRREGFSHWHFLDDPEAGSDAEYEATVIEETILREMRGFADRWLAQQAAGRAA